MPLLTCPATKAVKPASSRRFVALSTLRPMTFGRALSEPLLIASEGARNCLTGIPLLATRMTLAQMGAAMVLP